MVQTYDRQHGKPKGRGCLVPAPNIGVVCKLYLGFPGGSEGKESACNAGDLGSIPGSGRSTGEGNGNPLQSHGHRSLVGYSLWDHKKLDKTDWLLCNQMDKDLKQAKLVYVIRGWDSSCPWVRVPQGSWQLVMFCFLHLGTSTQIPECLKVSHFVKIPNSSRFVHFCTHATLQQNFVNNIYQLAIFISSSTQEVFVTIVPLF